MKKRLSINQWIVCGILFLIALCMIFPFIYIIMVSFTDSTVYQQNSLIIWPKKWSVEAYKLILTGSGFFNALKSSLFITLVGTPISIIVCSMFSYMLSRKSLPGNKLMLKLLILTMIFSPGMIPNYILLKNLGLLNTLWAVIIPSIGSAWTVLVMRSFYHSIPNELYDAAKIDGCGDIGVFFRIVLPLSKPMLAAFTLFSGVGYWNTYFSAILYINDQTKWPLQVFLQQVVLGSDAANFLNMGLQQPQNTVPAEVIQMATVVIVTLPILIIYPFLQKYFAKGVMLGSVKD